MPRGKPKKPKAEALPDFGAISLGDNPRQTTRVLGMVRAGLSLDHILEVGRYQRSWTKADVERILRANRVPFPDPPDPSPFSARPTSARTVKLTTTQVAVVHRVCQGLTNKEIADDLGLSPNTVRSYVSTILSEAGCRDRIALIIQVITGRLVPVTEDKSHADAT